MIPQAGGLTMQKALRGMHLLLPTHQGSAGRIDGDLTNLTCKLRLPSNFVLPAAA